MIKQAINVDLSDKQFSSSLSRPTSTMSRHNDKQLGKDLDREYLDFLKQKFRRDSDLNEGSDFMFMGIVKTNQPKKRKNAVINTYSQKSVKDPHSGAEGSSIISEQASK